jgi:carboxyvinyl-carboxyphosphonate phosphorylmutase
LSTPGSNNFRTLLAGPGIIVAPGVWDGFSAKLVEHLGFKAAYASGGMISSSLLGKPDIGLVTMSEMVTQVKNIVSAIDIPVISDADTGYGNAMNVMRTVKEFEQVGVAGIHIEDQELPKRCGNLEGKRIISRSEMVSKIKAAVDARKDRSFILIGRTDARGVSGLNEAIKRGRAYADAGADMLFIEAPQSLEDLKTIGNSFKNMPLMVAMGGNKTPNVPVKQLEAMGFKLVIFPGIVQKIAAKAILEHMQVFREQGDADAVKDKQLSFNELFGLLGIKEFFACEAKYMSE